MWVRSWVCNWSTCSRILLRPFRCVCSARGPKNSSFCRTPVKPFRGNKTCHGFLFVQMGASLFLISFHTSSQPLLSLQNRFINREAIMIRIEVFHRTSNMNNHSSSHCWMLLFPAEDTIIISPLWHHFLNGQSAIWCRVDYIGLLPTQCFVLGGIDITLDRYLLSVLVVHLPNNYIFNRYLSHSALHSIPRTKKPIPQQIKDINASMTMKFTGLNMSSILLKHLSWGNNMSHWNLSYIPARYELEEWILSKDRRRTV